MVTQHIKVNTNKKDHKFKVHIEIAFINQILRNLTTKQSTIKNMSPIKSLFKTRVLEKVSIDQILLSLMEKRHTKMNLKKKDDNRINQKKLFHINPIQQSSMTKHNIIKSL